MDSRFVLFLFGLFVLTAACAASSSPKGASAEPGSCPSADDPSVHYIDGSNEDRRICMTINFVCAEGNTLFSNECGCGCIETTKK